MLVIVYNKNFALSETQLRQEKMQLERTLEQEQEYQVNKLMRKIERLENETVSKQRKLEEVQYVICSSTDTIVSINRRHLTFEDEEYNSVRL